ncbi:MAG: hypothetical protein V4564_05865 [Pseudomonadota bacterium]
MPLVLFPELTFQLWRTGKALAPWSRLVGIEQTLLRRVESAYLTAWFGPNVPEKQLNLHIAIRNIAALRDQYQLAKRSRPDPISGISLLGPLSGIAGALLGAAMSPTGLILIVTELTKVGSSIAPIWNIVTVIGAIILFLPLTGLIAGVVVGIGLPFGLFAALGLGIAGDATTRSVITLLGDLGLMIDAMGRFWDQLSGPRDQVKNPLLRHILETLDRFAGLFIQVIGFVAFLFDRLLPLVPGLLAQFRAMSALVDTVMAALTEVLKGVVDTLFAPFDQKPGISDILDGIIDRLLKLPDKIIERVRAAIKEAKAKISPVVGGVSKQVKDYGEGFVTRLKDAFSKTVLSLLIDRIKALVDMLPAWKKAYQEIPKPADDDDGPLRDKATGVGKWLGAKALNLGDVRSAAADLLGSIDRLTFPDLPDLKVPDLPAMPKMPDLDAIEKAHPRPELPDFGALASDLFDQASEVYSGMKLPPEFSARPPSAFAGARKALESSAAMPVLTLDNSTLRDAIYLAVGRVLPPALRGYAPQARALFDTLDEKLYGAGAQTPEQKDALADQLLPVQDLGDTGLLFPKVGKLSFVGTDAETPDLRAFRDIVVAAFEKQPYLARAA